MPKASVRIIPGVRIGRLIVLKIIPLQGWSDKAECQCDCGKTATVYVQNLARKKRPTLSCGCIGKERAKAVNVVRLRTHGKRFTRTYRCWANMKTRATNPKSTRADRYYHRGIKICERWMTFENFLADMGDCRSNKHTIERVNNDGNYEPSNCVWATNAQQQRNKMSNHLITFNGETMCITSMAEKYGLNPVAVYARIKQLGWDVERAMTTPIKPSPRRILRVAKAQEIQQSDLPL